MRGSGGREGEVAPIIQLRSRESLLTDSKSVPRIIRTPTTTSVSIAVSTGVRSGVVVARSGVVIARSGVVVARSGVGVGAGTGTQVDDHLVVTSPVVLVHGTHSSFTCTVT